MTVAFTPLEAPGSPSFGSSRPTPRASRSAAALRRAVNQVSLPDRVVSVTADSAGLPPSHPAHGKRSPDGRPAAFICRGPVCSLPIGDPAALTAALARE
jgi:uncharacterized protein YyaL (SSP411 family)